MAAILMKVNKTVFLMVVFSPVIYAQKDCNKTTLFKRDQKNVPREVCLPSNYVITKVYTRDEVIDFNNDGLPDYVFAIERTSKVIGDSSYLIFFKMNADSSHTLVRRFGNIFPLRFDPNAETPDLKERRLIDVFDCYLVPDPMYSLEIKSDSIKLTRRLDGQDTELIKYVFTFDSNQLDWKLILKKRYSESNSVLYTIDEKIWLRDFSYCRE